MREYDPLTVIWILACVVLCCVFAIDLYMIFNAPVPLECKP